ncbi:MAG TPA: group III truncated hemoglobin [Flavobacteriaceae bacterium]|nr:group III truncated hemoglobin [Flavobacteriaceae bacterium]
MRKEIENKDDIVLLVDTFYGKVRQDELLSPIFNEVIKNNWPQHLAKMYRFWGSVLLSEKSYRGNPFMPHSVLPIEKNHFDRWLKLFHQTLSENFVGRISEEAIWRSGKMAEMFQMNLEYLRNTEKNY